MQKITRDILVDKAISLLESKTVTRVLGWRRGEFDYDASPAVFTDIEEIKREFVYSDFCGANLSKYLLKYTSREGEKVLVFLKPCDTYSFAQLLTEHRIDRERVYAVGIACDGMADIKRIKKVTGEGIMKIKPSENSLAVYTLYSDEPVYIEKKNATAERCDGCKSKKTVCCDETLGESEEQTEAVRFDGVERLEKMTSEERYAFWQGELSRCIRCNACRDVCPACTCEKCVFDNSASGVETKAPSDSFEEKMFHIIRALHVAGRCTDCGECSRVCPQGIPLHLLNRKLIKDINTLYGEYQAGETVGSASPLTSYSEDDPEPREAFERSGETK